MLSTGVSDENGALLDGMAAVGGATVNGVLVVEAPTRRVELNNLVAHPGLSWIVSGKASKFVKLRPSRDLRGECKACLARG